MSIKKSIKRWISFKAGLICTGLVVSLCVIGFYGLRRSAQEQTPGAEPPPVPLSEEIPQKPMIPARDLRDPFAEPIDPVLMAANALELIRARKDAEVLDFFTKVDACLLGGDGKIIDRRIEEFMIGLERPPTRIKGNPGASPGDASQSLEDRRLVHLSLKFYTHLLAEPDALLPTASHMAGFRADFINAANGFELDGMEKKLFAAIYKPTPVQFAQLSRLTSIPDLPKWSMLLFSMYDRWPELVDDPRWVGRSLGHLFIHWAQYTHPEAPSLPPQHWMLETSKMMLGKHGLVVAAQVMAGFAEVDASILDNADMNYSLAISLQAAWNLRWNRMWIRRADDIHAIGWKEVFADYIEGVARELRPDEMRHVTPGLHDALLEQRKRMIGQGYDPYEDPEYVNALKELAAAYPEFRIPVARVCMDVREFKYPVNPRGISPRKLLRNDHANHALNEHEIVDIVIQMIRERKDREAVAFLMQMDRRFLGETQDLRESRLAGVMNGFDLPVAKPVPVRASMETIDIRTIVDLMRGRRGKNVAPLSGAEDKLIEWRNAAVAYRVYERLLNEPDALLPTALHLTSTMPKAASMGSFPTNEPLSLLLKHAFISPTKTQFEQILRIQSMDRLLGFSSGYATDVGAGWLESVEEKPRLIGYCLGRLLGERIPTNPEILTKWIRSAGAKADIVQSAEFIAGLVDARPELKTEPGYRSILSSALGGAWSHRWKTMMADRGGVTQDMPWRELLDRFIADVAGSLKPEEQWYASLGVDSVLMDITNRTRMHGQIDDYVRNEESFSSALRDAAGPFFPFKVASERMLLSACRSGARSEERKPVDIDPCLKEFLTSDEAPSGLRFQFAEELIEAAYFDFYKIAKGSIDTLNFGVSKAYRDWVNEGGRPIDGEWIHYLGWDGKIGPEWNHARMSIGQFLTEISDKTKDEDVGKSAKRLAMHLLVRSGSLRLVGEFVSRNRDFFAWDTSLIVKLIEAGDVDAAAALCGGEMKRFPFRAHGTYTKVFHDNLGRFLEKIGDPTLRYILSVSFNSMETPREEDAPSCLLRMRPLVEAFDQIHFPDEKSRVIYLSMMCKPAFFDIAGLKRALEEWDKMYDREKMIDLFGRDNAASAAAVHDALEIATMGLMLRDLRIEELGNRLEPSLVIYENTGSNENYLLRVIERLCEESLYHAGNGNLEAVAACAPLSRKIYLAMARRASKAGSDGESAHVWMDMCHSAGNTMDSIPPWIDGVGGHVAEIHRNRVAQMKFLRRNSLHDLFSCLPYSIRERWGDDEYSSKRRGAVLCFLNDDEIRKSFADKSVDLGPSGVNDIRAIYTKDILAAMDVWSEMHSDRAHQIKPIRDELIRLFPDTNGH